MYRMVIIDDEKWAVRSLLSILRGQSLFELAGEAYDGPGGLMLLQREKPDLAFVDVQMPGISGLELLQRAGEIGLPTLFIMISGHAEFAYAQKAMFYDALCYCLKPFSKSELMDGIEKAHRRLTAREIPSREPPAEKPLSPEEPPAMLTTANRSVGQMLRYIHQNYQTDISVRDLAVLCSINQSYAGQLFRQETGETFSGYLTRVRMEKASGLLLETSRSIASIAADVGYGDYFYFAKVFKKVMGVTPSAYRGKK